MTDDFLQEALDEADPFDDSADDNWWELCDSDDLDFDSDWNEADMEDEYEEGMRDWHESYKEWLHRRGERIRVQTELPEDEYCETCGRSCCDCDKEEE